LVRHPAPGRQEALGRPPGDRDAPAVVASSNVGIAGILGFYSHTFNAAATAEFIAWAPGSPFQFEVATANLAFGVLGVLCLWFGGAFWAATASASRCSSRVQPTAAFATSSYTTTTRPVTPG